jgi:hypothetical protein
VPIDETTRAALQTGDYNGLQLYKPMPTEYKDFGDKKTYVDNRQINRFYNLLRFSSSESPRRLSKNKLKSD